MWWKLKTEGCCEEFRKDLRQTLGGREELPGEDQRAAVWLRAETTDVCFECFTAEPHAWLWTVGGGSSQTHRDRQSKVHRQSLQAGFKPRTFTAPRHSVLL